MGILSGKCVAKRFLNGSIFKVLCRKAVLNEDIVKGMCSKTVLIGHLVILLTWIRLNDC